MDDDGIQAVGPNVAGREIVTPFEFSDSESRTSLDFEMYLGELESYFEELEVSLLPEQKEQDPEKVLWDSLPEEVLCNILMRLPIGARCRCRKVCPKWNILLSTPFPRQHGSQVESRSSCTILFDRRSSEGKFFSHEENKWFRMPFRPTRRLDLNWRLRATDNGLVCYQAYVYEDLWLLVCNPINGSSQVIPPRYPTANRMIDDDDDLEERPKVVNFAVDQEAKSFRVVLVHHTATMFFNSKGQEWKFSKDVYCSALEQRDFLWSRMIYKSSLPAYEAFDMESGTWNSIEMHLPCDLQKKYHIMRNKRQVMVVQFLPKEDELIQIWMLDVTHATTSSPWRWEKIAIQVPVAMGPLVDEIDQCWCHGREFICFATCRVDRWIKYTFRTKTWRVMPCSERKFGGRTDSPIWGECPIWYKWVHWEPCIDFVVKSVNFNEKHYPRLAEFRRERDRGEFSSTDYADEWEDSDEDDCMGQ